MRSDNGSKIQANLKPQKFNKNLKIEVSLNFGTLLDQTLIEFRVDFRVDFSRVPNGHNFQSKPRKKSFLKI